MDVACLYHGVDIDGYLSAAIVKNYVGDDIEMIPMSHGQKTPDLTDYSTIYIVDFCLSREEMLQLNSTKNLIWIDHHTSSLELMQGEEIKGFQNTK